MMKRLVIVLSVLAIIAAMIPVLALTTTASACDYEGRTPGYWKNHLSAWVGYSPNDSFEGKFGVDIAGPDVTLLQALQKGGGEFVALDRHAVAALLNAAARMLITSTVWHR